MFSAKEARENTRNAIAVKHQAELNGVEKSIQKAIDAGKYSCNYYNLLGAETIKYLRLCGYTVTTNSMYNEIDYTISWEDK